MPESRLSVRLRQAAPTPLDVEFSCGPGEVLAIFGPSGAGKTTILRAIAGLHRPTESLVRSGADTWEDTRSEIFAAPHRRAVGFVFQEYALFPHLTALGNVMTALGHRPRADRRRRAESLLALVHLSEQASRHPRQLSGGERQRVALARALAREPAVLLLDEPFAAVDRAVRRRLQEEIDGLRRTLDIPLILVTHDFEDVVRLATHALILERGRAVACDALPTLTSRPDLAWLREAVGLGSIFDARVARTLPERGLVELAFDGGSLLAADRAVAVGAGVRARIAAREVILATGEPKGLSVHNVLRGTVSGLHVDPAFEHVIVQIAVGGVLLLAEVTRDAIETLGITAGREVYALIKSVSIRLVEIAQRDERPPHPDTGSQPTQRLNRIESS